MKTLLFIIILAGLSNAGDWPQFKRTANRQGCALSEQVALPARLCCWVDFGSPIRAPASIVNGKAYAISGRGVLARIDLATNSVDWHVSLGGVNNESAPSVENNRVYVGSTAGNFYVLNAETGAILKTYPAGDAVLSSPLLYRGSVYFGSADGVFHALDMDGELKWTFRTGGPLWHSAAADSDWIVFADGMGKMYWLSDGGTHADSIRSTPVGREDALVSTPMIYANKIFITKSVDYGKGRIRVFDEYNGDSLDTGNPPQFSFLTWQLGNQGTWTQCPISVDTEKDRYFIPTSRIGLRSLPGDWNTIISPYWDPIQNAGDILGVNSAPAVVGNSVIFGGETGKIQFRNKEDGASLWSYSLASGQSVESSPAVSDGKVVMGSFDGHLYGFWDGVEATSPVLVNPMKISDRSLRPAGTWSLTVFPNPASGSSVTFSMDGISPGGTISVYSVTGALIGKLVLTGKEVKWNLKDVRGRVLPAGTYFAKVSDRTGRTIRSFSIKVAG